MASTTDAIEGASWWRNQLEGTRLDEERAHCPSIHLPPPFCTANHKEQTDRCAPDAAKQLYANTAARPVNNDVPLRRMMKHSRPPPRTHLPPLQASTSPSPPNPPQPLYYLPPSFHPQLAIRPQKVQTQSIPTCIVCASPEESRVFVAPGVLFLEGY